MEEVQIFSDTHMNKSMILSRYMDLPKFIDLLNTSELHLASAVDFEDNMEGTLPELIRNDLVDLDEFKKDSKGKTIEEIEYENKLRTNLSCWTIGYRDNMALWKIYGRDEHSVRISTTFKRLLYSTPNWKGIRRITFKKVRYIDLAGKIPDGVYALDEHIFGLKHHAYKYENEVRIVTTRTPQQYPTAIRQPIILNDLLTKVTVAPNAGQWFFEVVKDLIKKYKVSVPVEMSGLSALIKRAKANK